MVQNSCNRSGYYQGASGQEGCARLKVALETPLSGAQEILTPRTFPPICPCDAYQTFLRVRSVLDRVRTLVNQVFRVDPIRPVR